MRSPHVINQPSHIWIIGPRGAGKSKLAARLAEKLGLQTIELDALHDTPCADDKRAVLQRKLAQADRNGWIAVGNDVVFRELLSQRASHVIQLRCRLPWQLWHILKRALADLLLWRTRAYAKNPLDGFANQLCSFPKLIIDADAARLDLQRLAESFVLLPAVTVLERQDARDFYRRP